jgi:hypothetical protein
MKKINKFKATFNNFIILIKMKKLFKKKEDSTGQKDHKTLKKDPKGMIDELTVKKKLNLPKNFAKRIIDYENLCERPDVTMQTLNELMDLYTVISYLSINNQSFSSML